MDKIKVMLVDNHAIIRDGIRALLSSRDDMEIVGEASEGNEAIDKARTLNPDVIIMDDVMPRMDGLEATRRIVRQNPTAKVLILTESCDRWHVVSSAKAGAAGHVPKWALCSDLISAVRAAHRDDLFLFPTAISSLVRGFLQEIDNGPYDRLTGREREILNFVVEGQTSRQIAACLCISLRTVHGHRNKLMRKLGVHNGIELAKYAVRQRLSAEGAEQPNPRPSSSWQGQAKPTRRKRPRTVP